MRDVLADDERRRGVRRAELDAAHIPPACAELYALFCLASELRPAAIAGVAPLAPSELEALLRLTGVQLSAWEAETLFRLDAALRADLAPQDPKDNPTRQ